MNVVAIKAQLTRGIDKLMALFGRGVVLTAGLVLLIGLAISLAMFGFFDAAALTSM